MQPQRPRRRFQELLERPAEPRLKSPFARAVVPVLSGIAFFAVLGLVLFVVAWVSSSNNKSLGATEFRAGRVDVVADSIKESGPLIYPGLVGSRGDNSIVIDHTGTDDVKGWSLYAPYPADRPGTECLATQVEKTRKFTDCDGRVIDVGELQRADFAELVIENNQTVIIRLKKAQPIPQTTTQA